jgi:G:T/U-mismatch repair DNA glycosylase
MNSPGIQHPDHPQMATPISPPALSDEAATDNVCDQGAKDKEVALSGKRKTVKMNISRVKFHFLGDYVKTIRRFGTTDLYSTELVSPLHFSGVFLCSTPNSLGRAHAPFTKEVVSPFFKEKSPKGSGPA